MGDPINFYSRPGDVMGDPINFYSRPGVGSSVNTVLYLPIESDYTDLTGRHTFTAVGSTTIDSNTSYFGTASLLMTAPTGPGQNSNIGTVLVSSTSLNYTDFNLGTADFVIDCAVRIASLLTNGGAALDVIAHGTKYGGAFPGEGVWYIYLYFGGSSFNFRFGYTTTGVGSQFEKTFPTTSGGSFSPQVNEWYRLTAIRSGADLNLHLSGGGFNNSVESYSIGTIDFGISSGFRLGVGGEYLGNSQQVNKVTSFGGRSSGYIDSWLGWIDYVLINKNVSELPSNRPINFYSK